MLHRVARDLADAQAVLSSLPSPELFPGVGQTLELLAAAGRDVAACEDSRLQKDWDCGGRLFPRTWDLKHLQVWERPVALEAELALTLAVLEAMANSSLGRSLEQPLLTLQHVHSKLQACVPAQPTAGPRPRGRLHHWLHRLQEAQKKEDSLLQKDWECTSHLFPRTRDLKHLQLCPRPVPLALPPITIDSQH
ncbi:hypothetical protein MJT46_013227 [Ovis ammon polii x Ovis aries]|nr:hypothetical protein MJT46_013227 [Ovis ammon polii x Ovis aries]